MTEQEFRDGMNAASRANDLFWVSGEDGASIAVGLDSSRGVAILHGGKEVPITDLRACHPFGRA